MAFGMAVRLSAAVTEACGGLLGDAGSRIGNPHRFDLTAA